jgi:hypothetical protein
MNTTATIFLYLLLFLIGVAIGGIIEHALKKRSTPRPALPDTTTKLAGDGDVEVFGAWRTSENKVWLDMDGKRVDNKEALQPEQSQRLLNLVLDLRPWLETARAAVPVPEAAPQQVRQVKPEPGIVAQPIQTKNNISTVAGEEIHPTPVLESIIEQIDKVLQVKLATSLYKDRDIRLIEGPGGIVIIKDGLNRYEGVDTVPDPQVKILIQEAVADWEKGTK